MDRPVLLLVEDDALVLIAAEDALEGGGYAVTAATDGRQALAALEVPSPGFAGVVTDIHLGSGPDGWEVARRARELQADMPIVYVTAEARASGQPKAFRTAFWCKNRSPPPSCSSAIATLITAADTNRTT